MLLDIVVNRVDQLGNVFEDASSDALVCEISKESLDHVEPRGAGGSEVDMKAPMFGQPTLDLLMLVGGIVVHDQMEIFLFGGLLINEF